VNRIPSDLLASITPDLERTVATYAGQRHLAGAAVGIVIDDRLAWSHGVGHADQASGRPMDARTLVRIASISKTFTATAIVQLREAGRLRLDDPMVTFIPELRHAHSPFGPIEEVTIRRVLQHSSGLACEPDMPGGQREYPWALESRLSAIESPERIRVVDPPGSVWRYSNLGYALLSVVVERVTGRPHVDVVRDGITTPLGMAATTSDPTGDLAERCAQGYDRYAYSDRLQPARPFDSEWAIGNGELWSCVEDLARWASAQFVPYGSPAPASEILAHGSVREMHRQTVVIDKSWSSAQGLGWIGVRDGDLITVGHTGGLPGFVTVLELCLDDRVAGITLFNTWPGRGRSLSRSLLDQVLPLVRVARAQTRLSLPVAVTPQWRDRLGSYWDPETGDRAVIIWRDGQPCLLLDPSAPAGTALPLHSTDDPLRFTARDDDDREQGFVVFVADDAGRVDFLTLDAFPYLRETPDVAPVA
jgi:CubicO group peptidase (beta-lactamase class C family)